MAKVTIDGREVEVPKGRLVLEVAQDLGIDVPTFCYQERLAPLASCRMCLIEIEGHRKLEPACATPVTDGMVIRTDSELVAETRQSMLEMLLANHPLDCPVCDKGGECELQDQVFKYGAGESRFRDQKRVFRDEDILLNSVIIFNANRCIQCQRCVRICEEVVGAVALGTIDKGMDSEVTGFAGSLEGCDHCGNCIEVCPVGALMNNPYRYKSRPWDLVETETVCGLCGTGCAMTVGVRDGQLARVRSRYETGMNGELLCAKGRFGFDVIDTDKRLRRPKIRKNGALIAVGWDEALGFLGERLREIRKNGGGIGGIASPRMTNETLYLFQKMMRTVLKTNNIDSATRWASSRVDAALARILSDFNTRRPLHRLLEADCLFVIGSAVTDDNPVTDYLLRGAVRRAGASLLMASARPSRLDRDATASLRLLPGSEASLLAALVGGLEADAVADAPDFQAKAVATMRAASSVKILVGIDMLRSPAADQSLAWLYRLAGALKDAGKTPEVQFLFDRPNQLGAIDMGVLPGDQPGADLSGMLRDAEAGKLQALWVCGSDPLLSFPDPQLMERALDSMTLLVVQDAYQSDLAARADVVLPGANFAEEQGTFTSNEGRVQRVRGIRQPSFEAKSNIEIFSLAALAMGHDLGPTAPDRVFAEFCRLLPAYQGLDFEALGDNGIFTTATTTTTPVDVPESTPLDPPADTTIEPGTLALVTGDCRFHSGMLTAHSTNLAALEAEPYMEMSVADAASLGLEDGASVSVSSGLDSVTVTLRVHKRYGEGIVFIPENFPTLGLNGLFAGGNYPCRVSVKAAAKAEVLVSEALGTQ